MTRRRWIYPKGGEPFEVSPDYEQPVDRTAGDSVLWNDRAYQDMNDPRFKSRSQHRAFMAANGLTTADDFTNTWKKSEEQRREISAGVNRTRKNDMVEAFRKISNGYRPRQRVE